MKLDWFLTLLTSFIILLGGVIHGTVGFGFAQVVMGLLPLFRNPATASIIFTVNAIVMNFRVFWSVRKHFEWKNWAIPVIGLIFGLPLGIYFFELLNARQFRLAIGITLLISVILIGFMRKRPHTQEWIERRGLQPGWKIGIVVGFVAGFLGGSVAIPGPPMILYGGFLIASKQWEARQMKAVFTAFFGTLMTYRLVNLTITGAVTISLTIEAVIALPALLVGALIGIMIFDRVPKAKFDWLVLGGLTVNAFVLIITTL